MRNSDILVFGVLYPGVEKFTTSFVKSIISQDDQNFDLALYDDGFGNSERLFLPLRTIVIRKRGDKSIAEIRQIGINFAMNKGYQSIVFADLDDTFSSNRISGTRSLLKKSDFVYCELALIDHSNSIVRENVLQSIGVRPRYTGYKHLLDKNIFGLSNTAINVHCLSRIKIPKDIIAVDWWLFSMLSLNGCCGSLLNNSYVYYRQTDTNLIGMKNMLTEEKLKLGIQVKLVHYTYLLRSLRARRMTAMVRSVSLLKREIGELETALQDHQFLEHYLSVVNDNYQKIFTGWWSDILPLKKWKEYEK